MKKYLKDRSFGLCLAAIGTVISVAAWNGPMVSYFVGVAVGILYPFNLATNKN